MTYDPRSADPFQGGIALRTSAQVGYELKDRRGADAPERLRPLPQGAGGLPDDLALGTGQLARRACVGCAATDPGRRIRRRVVSLLTPVGEVTLGPNQYASCTVRNHIRPGTIEIELEHSLVVAEGRVVAAGILDPEGLRIVGRQLEDAQRPPIARVALSRARA